MNKKIILFDIDDTLIEVHKMSKMLYQQMANMAGITLEEVIAAKERYKLTIEKTSDYKPDDLMVFVYDDLKTETLKQTNPFTEEAYYEESLFPEVKIVFEKLKKDYILGIFSEGFIDYQSNKIKLSGLDKFFDKNFIFIERRKTDPESIKKLPMGSIIVDDRKEVIEKLKTLNKFNLIWINRNNDETINGITTIKNLNELLNLLK